MITSLNSKLLNGDIIYVSNDIASEQPVINFSRRTFQRNQLNIHLVPTQQHEKIIEAMKILNEVLEGYAIDQPQDSPSSHLNKVFRHAVVFREFQENSLLIEVYYWFKSSDWWERLEFGSVFNTHINKRFCQAGIQFSIPIEYRRGVDPV